MGTASCNWVRPTFTTSVELDGLARQCLSKMSHGSQQLLAGLDGRDPDRGGIDVVGRLTHIHMPVRVNHRVVTLVEAEDLQCAVGDDFVGVHVRRGSGAALDDIHDELVQQAAPFDVLAGAHDRIRLDLIYQAQI
jgi:hypothetical protein